METLKQMFKERQHEIEHLVENYENEINREIETPEGNFLFQKDVSEEYVIKCEKANR